MWSLKFQIFDEENIVRKLIKKHKVTAYYYPINCYKKNKRYFFVSVGIIKGEDKKVKSFFKDVKNLKKTKNVRRLESLEYENQFFMLISSHPISAESKKYVHIFYNPRIIHLKPVIFRGDGEEWEIVSLKREELKKLIEVGKKIYDFKFLKLYWKKVKNFGFLTILPELTGKQESALNLAYSFGYYNYPRKISLDKLAKTAKVSFSTFHAHIRKAENKILSFILDLKK